MEWRSNIWASDVSWKAERDIKFQLNVLPGVFRKKAKKSPHVCLSLLLSLLLCFSVGESEGKQSRKKSWKKKTRWNRGRKEFNSTFDSFQKKRGPLLVKVLIRLFFPRCPQLKRVYRELSIAPSCCPWNTGIPGNNVYEFFSFIP